MSIPDSPFEAPTADFSPRPPVRENVTFDSGGQRCDGWLYRPPSAGPHPCVVLAHGIGGIRSAALPAFATRFTAAGIAALTFDYRHLGTSAGQPRGLIDIRRAGPPGSMAMLTTPDAVAGFESILPADPVGFEPAVAARIVLQLRSDRPAAKAAMVQCPLLVCVREHDAIAPPRPAIRVAEEAPRGELLVYPIGHFDLFTGSWFDQVVGDQVLFLRRILLGGTVSNGQRSPDTTTHPAITKEDSR